MNLNNPEEISLEQAATTYITSITSLSTEKKAASQQEVYRFIRWFGRERNISGIRAPEIAKYTEQLSLSDTDYERKLYMVKAFLIYAKKEGWSQTNLAIHLKSRRGKVRIESVARKDLPDNIAMTQEGYNALKDELVILKTRRIEAIEETRKAAADKDFRENAPFHAAREQRGHLEGRIQEVESTLKLAKVIDGTRKSVIKIIIGSSVTLRKVETGEKLNYIIVSPKEVDLAKCKISNASPIGKALIGKKIGETVEVLAPAGKLHYLIEEISF